jgi:hypothetical protein
MALRPELIFQGAQQAVQANQPIQSLLSGIGFGQQLAGNRLNQLAQLEQMERARAQESRAVELAPLQRKRIEQQIEAGDLRLEEAQRTGLREGTFKLASEASALPLESRAQYFRENARGLGPLAAEAANASDEEINEIIPKLMSEGFKQGVLKDTIKTSQGTANMHDFEFYQDLKKRDPKGAEMFGKDVGLIPKDKPISSASEKNLIAAQDKFFELTSQSREYDLLADDFERFANQLPAGTAASISEFIKRVTGSQDEATELRRRFSKVRLAEALKFLPPGPATDRDVAEAFKGVPDENASPRQVQSFLRGAAKMASIDAEFQEFKSNYISENDSSKGLIPAWEKHIADGNAESINALTPANEEPQQEPTQAPQSMRFIYNPTTGRLEAQ